MNEGLPQPRRAIGWYRRMLWVMPACIAITSGLGLVWLEELGFERLDLVSLGWWIFNLLAAIGLGIFEAKLEHPRWHGQAVRFEPTRVVKFVALQFIIVPLLTCVVILGFYLVAIICR